MRSRSGAELPQLELECLRALWELEPASVAVVQHRLGEHGRLLAYTTVLTVLDRLRRKQAVSRERRGRAFVYRAVIARDRMREAALARLVENYFQSREELHRYLMLPEPASAAEPPSSAVAARESTPSLDDADGGLDAALL